MNQDRAWWWKYFNVALHIKLKYFNNADQTKLKLHYYPVYERYYAVEYRLSVSLSGIIIVRLQIILNSLSDLDHLAPLYVVMNSKTSGLALLWSNTSRITSLDRQLYHIEITWHDLYFLLILSKDCWYLSSFWQSDLRFQQKLQNLTLDRIYLQILYCLSLKWVFQKTNKCLEFFNNCKREQECECSIFTFNLPGFILALAS